MEHLNYCRQFIKSAGEALSNPAFPKTSVGAYARAMEIAAGAEKFLLPPGGLLFVDHEFRGMDHEMRLHLPFPAVALEYSNGPMRCILIAVEYGDEIVVQPIVRTKDSQWSVLFRAAIPTSDYFARDSGTIKLNVITSKDNEGRQVRVMSDGEDITEFTSFHDAPIVLMHWLNAMGCINVKAELSVPRKQPKASKQALPFDSYRILKLDIGPTSSEPGSPKGGRSPREHVRRGHIRRYEDGKKVWINAAVVNPGVGGKVFKDYALRGGVA